MAKNAMTDEARAAQIFEALGYLNEAVSQAQEAGLQVAIDVMTVRRFGARGDDITLNARVARPIHPTPPDGD